MKLIAVTSALSLIALAIFLGNPRPKVVRAQSGCALDALSVPYGYTLTGTYYDNQGYTYVYASSGILIPDGQGNLTGTDTASNDGYVTQQRALTGKYVVNSNCTGTAQLTYSDQTSLTLDFVLVNGGKGINFIDTDPGLILHGTATQQ